MSQQTIKPEKTGDTSGDVLETQIRKMRSLFPDVFLEGGKDDDAAQSQGSRAAPQLELRAARAAHNRP